MKLVGGYLSHRRPAIRVGHNTHTTDLEQPISPLAIGALNSVQETPWRINRWLLDVMQDAWTAGLRIGGLEVGEPLPIPGGHWTPEGKWETKLPDAVWAGMSPADRNDYVGKRVAAHAKNAKIMSQSRAILDAMSVAEELRNREAIYYPHSLDFRGRIYPQATFGPHPQGSDIQQALIMFAEGLPLGDDGEYWLRIRAANAWGDGSSMDKARKDGADKITLEERVAWTLAHQTEIETAATNPLASTWWAQADEPWNFLATCHELVLATISSKEFVSHLPIPLDGSCNGLQHLAAMGLDPVGAAATNLSASAARQDIYEEVAKRVRLQVEQDVLDGVDAARVWHGNITRKVVKRAVMTTPYGVTDRGIRDQLIRDGFVPDDETIGRDAAADYLRDRLVQALGDTVQSARGIMAWLQTTADRLARAGLPFDWTTPSGSRVREAYKVNTQTRLVTLVGRATLYSEVKAAGLNTRKQALGSAPNVIHSFDAAHLSMTVDAAARDGIKAFAMIHDSYGTHAGNTTRLAAILRQKFVDIYRTDWLKCIKDEIAGYAPWVPIEEPPERGTFDIEQVIDAPYFFS